MTAQEAQAIIKINKLLEAVGRRFFEDGLSKLCTQHALCLVQYLIGGCRTVVAVDIANEKKRFERKRTLSHSYQKTP